MSTVSVWWVVVAKNSDYIAGLSGVLRIAHVIEQIAARLDFSDAAEGE